MKILAMFAVGLALALGACGRDPGPQGQRAIKDRKGRLARRARKVFKASPAFRDKPVRKARKVRKAHPANGGATGEKGAAGDVAGLFRVVQGDGPAACEASETLVSVICPSGGAPDGTKCATVPTVGLCLKK